MIDIDIFKLFEKNVWPTDQVELQYNSVFVDLIMTIIFEENQQFTFVEVGALDGKDSLYTKTRFPNCNVHCVEGMSENYNTHLKDITSISTHHICISSTNGFADFYPKGDGSSGISGIYDRGKIYGTEVRRVPTMTLKKFAELNSLSTIDAIKIDVEGATFDVLNSMGSDLLNGIKVMHIETEDYPFFSNQKLKKDVAEILNNNFTLILQSSYNPQAEGKQYDEIWVNNAVVHKFTNLR